MPQLRQRSYADFVQLSLLQSTQLLSVDVAVDGEVSYSKFKPEENGSVVCHAEKKPDRLSHVARLSYGVGHVMNDLCASMWFTHLLIFYQKVVQLSSVGAGTLLLIGQIVDGLATPLVGIESDRSTFTKYGRRKVWHIGGSIAVALTFPFIFNLCIGCENSDHWALFIYYVPFIVVFQIGWAAVQISHLSLIPDLAYSGDEKVILNALRYGFTIFSNIFVYAVFWVLFEVNSTPGTLGRQDAPKFRNLVFIVVSVGIAFSIIFHLGVKERPKVIDEKEESMLASCIKMKKTCWKAWLKEIQFWQIGMIYMMTRLIVNLTQVYIPLYVTDSLFLDKKTIAIIPLVIYVSGICATLATKPMSSFCGLKITYFVGLILIFGSSFWIWFLGGLPIGDRQGEMYGAAVVIGFGCSTLLVTSLAMTAELVGDNTSTGAFIYGAMSFFDKVANGIAVMAIQKLHPGTDATPGGETRCPTCAHYYRVVMSCLPGGAAFIAMLILATLAKSKIGSTRNKKPKCKNESNSAYGSIKDCSPKHNVNGDPNSIHDRADNSSILGTHASLLGCGALDDDTEASPKERELEVCAENCKCKICIDQESGQLTSSYPRVQKEENRPLLENNQLRV